MTESLDELYTDTDQLLFNTETEYLIGDDNCQFHTIVRILQPENSTIFDQKLIDIAIDLNIPGGTIAHWRRGINFGNLSNDVLLYELLKEFRSKYASDATLIKFMDALYKKDLFEEAENLGAHFGIDLTLDKQFVQLRTNKDFWAKLACGISVVITVFIIALTISLPYLQNGGNEFHGCPISSMINEEIYNTTIKWANDIKNADVSSIYNILHHCELSNKTNLLLSDAVHKAYNDNVDNFPPIFKFLRGIFSPMYRFTAYAALLASMQRNQDDDTLEMLKFVYFIKIDMDSEKFDSELYEKYTNLTNLVQQNLHAIMFRECVTIHINYSEHIYLSYNSTESVHYLKTEYGKHLKDFPAAFWYFEVDFENDKLYYQIQKHVYDDNLAICPSSEYVLNQGHKMVECNKNDQLDLRWVLEPVKYNSDFLIRRVDGCVLYAQNRIPVYEDPFVLTWAGDCNNTLNYSRSSWEISPCPST